MRLAFLALILVAPLALAQTTPKLSLETQAFDAPIMPLVTTSVTRFVAKLDCAMLIPSTTPLALHVWVAKAPAFAKASLSPETFEVDPQACRTTGAEFSGEVKLGLDETAPAHEPQALALAAALEGDPRGNITTTADLPFEAAFFSILDVSVPEAVKVGQPEQNVTFAVTITNRGNAKTTVAFALADASEGIRVVLPNEVSLVSQGSSTVEIIAKGDGDAMTNRVGVMNVLLTSRDALTGAAGDQTTVSLLLTTKGAVVPTAPVLLALFAAALILGRRAS